jgi:hypothetical protein
MPLRLIFLSLFLLLFLSNPLWADEQDGDEDIPVALTREERQSRFLQTTLAGAGVVTVWGVLNWDYFTKSPSGTSEGWFGNDTKSGGADKMGHAYTTYAFSHALSYLYEYWGFNHDNAALYGTLSSYTIMTYMELGDAFSDFGTSYEDLIANTVGAMLGYVLYKNDDLGSKIDFRWEYNFKFSDVDLTTDYENSKYLLALKLNGFEATRDSFWRHLEFHLGYYTRNFDTPGGDRERNLYVGIGLNLTDLLYRNSWKKTGTVLRYIQLPYTSISVDHDFN